PGLLSGAPRTGRGGSGSLPLPVGTDAVCSGATRQGGGPTAVGGDRGPEPFDGPRELHPAGHPRPGALRSDSRASVGKGHDGEPDGRYALVSVPPSVLYTGDR